MNARSLVIARMGAILPQESVICAGRLVVMRTSPVGAVERVLVAGVLLGDEITGPLQGTGDHELWECDVVLIPRRRWGEPAQHMRGERIDQMLSGDGLDDACYGRQLYPAPAEGKKP